MENKELILSLIDTDEMDLFAWTNEFAILRKGDDIVIKTFCVESEWARDYGGKIRDLEGDGYIVILELREPYLISEFLEAISKYKDKSSEALYDFLEEHICVK